MADFQEQEQLHKQDQQLQQLQQQGFRGLYEQNQSKTLFFTTSTSKRLRQTNGRKTAYAGIYQCILEPDNNFDDFNDGDESRESCHVATKLGDWNNIDGTEHYELVLRNLQFDLSSLRSPLTDITPTTSTRSTPSTSESHKKNYLYANTHASYSKKDEVSEWEIVRAELPQKDDYDSEVLNEDGTLRFESVFRTKEAIEWNECEFDCCVQNDKIDEKWEEGTNNAHRHAYSETIVRSFVVDEHTGDVFVSWEGFYKDCGNFYASAKKLQWTIGVSRLKMEHPKCTFNDEAYPNDLHFVECTEPVSIVYQSTRGREVVLPYGGLAVIPSSSIGDGNGIKRSFLLSVLSSRGLDSGESTSAVWAFPEGVNSQKDEIKRQDLTGTGTVVDKVFMDANIWDGGSLRLHYNPVTRNPDHLCRTIYNKGIECLPITTSLLAYGVPLVEATGKPENFLSKEQTGIFCHLENLDRSTNGNDLERVTTLVSGLDVQWDDATGNPKRIFFGCWGGESGSGNFGSVEKGGKNLRLVLDGAFADAVLFLPLELEGTTDPRQDESTQTVSSPPPSFGYSSSRGVRKLSFSNFTTVVLALLMAACLALYERKRKREQKEHQQHSYDEQFLSPTALQIKTGFRTPYVELQSFDTASEMLL